MQVGNQARTSIAIRRVGFAEKFEVECGLKGGRSNEGEHVLCVEGSLNVLILAAALRID